MGVGDTFHPTPVGVFFGGPGEPGSRWPTRTSAAPGRDRNACIDCGECMTGCRHNAKNTLVKNYLYLAEQAGAEVLPLTTVTDGAPPTGGGYDVDARWSPRPGAPAAHQVLTAEQVVFAAAALGTQKLLHRMRTRATCPALSDRLGQPDPHQLRVDPRRDRPDTDVDYSQGRRDHLVVPPRRGHPHRAGALRQGQQRDGAAADRAHRRRRTRAALGTWLKEMWRSSGNVLATSTTRSTGRSGRSSRW